MERKIYYYASTSNDLTEICAGAHVYSKKNVCLLNLAYDLMKKDGIKPNKGVLSAAELNENEYSLKEYTLIERYNKQFNKANVEGFIYQILIDDEDDKENIILSKDTSVFKCEKVSSIIKYLAEADNVSLIYNDDLDKYWYGIPSDDLDVLKEYFSIVVKEENQDKRKKMINKLIQFYPKKKNDIKKIVELMNMTSEQLFLSFFDDPYKLHYQTPEQEIKMFTKFKKSK